MQYSIDCSSEVKTQQIAVLQESINQSLREKSTSWIVTPLITPHCPGSVAGSLANILCQWRGEPVAVLAKWLNVWERQQGILGNRGIVRACTVEHLHYDTVGIRME